MNRELLNIEARGIYFNNICILLQINNELFILSKSKSDSKVCDDCSLFKYKLKDSAFCMYLSVCNICKCKVYSNTLRNEIYKLHEAPVTLFLSRIIKRYNVGKINKVTDDKGVIDILSVLLNANLK